MDIWRWFYDTASALADSDPALANRLANLPSQVVDGHHDQVDAAVPELLAAARRLESPWLEVFVRHWRLQSWVFHRHDIERGMPEALELLERAHRDDMVSCPQTTCVTQDVCAATGHADGPGYAPERLQISAETLDRIDPSWPCWSCISTEHMSALNDAGRHDDALAWATTQVTAMREAGQEVTTGDFAFDRARALIALGRADEALEVVDQAEAPGKGDQWLLEKRVQRARVLAVLGRSDEAIEALPPFGAIADSGSLFLAWADAQVRLLESGKQPWSATAVHQLATMVHELQRLGCPRQALQIAVWSVALCAGGESREVGRAFLELARAQLPRLHRPMGAPEAVEAAASALTAVAPLQVPTSIEQAEQTLQDDDGLQFDTVMVAHRAFPAHEVLARAAAGGWTAFGFPDRAGQLLRDALATHPESAELYLELGQSLVAAADWAALRGHVAAHPDPAADGDLSGHAAWLRVQLADGTGDADGALTALEQLWAARAQWCGAGVPARLAAMYRERDRLQDALDALEAARELVDGTTSLDWDHMTVAVRLGRWDLMRRTAAGMGMPVDPEGEGPTHDDWGLCRLQYPPGDRAVYARRIGPVTAEVLQIRGPGAPERVRDVVVFDAARLDGAGDDAAPLFQVDAVLQPGGYTAVALDGVHPGEERLQELAAQLQAHGLLMQVSSTEQYHVHDPDTGESKPAVYVRVAMPDPALAPAALTAFEAVAAATEGAQVWPELLELVGRDAEAGAHRVIADTWGM